jgi:hypothetical protein
MPFRTMCSLVFFLVLGASLFAIAQIPENFRLEALAGYWQGQGEVLLPNTSLTISIDGKAVFTYDSLTSRLRTQIDARKFIFSYADSGYLYHDTGTDSISWDTWNSSGKHVRYIGIIKNSVFTGADTRHGYLYRVKIDFITADSLDFTLTATDHKGDSTTQAAITLWRSKNE